MMRNVNGISLGLGPDRQEAARSGAGGIDLYQTDQEKTREDEDGPNGPHVARRRERSTYVTCNIRHDGTYGLASFDTHFQTTDKPLYGNKQTLVLE
jgi:hypothetical protein